MPSVSEHSARINSPDKYEKIRRKNDEFGSGIHVLYGVLKDGKTEVQAIHFDKSKFTAAEAKKWLKEHDYSPTEFVAATEKDMNMNIQYKIVPFKIMETRETKSNKLTGDGEEYGCIKGYASTYGNLDRSNDIILEGAFLDSIQDYKNKGRPVKVYYQHNTMELPIGGISCEDIDSDKMGLPVTINVNKNVQRGKEVYALAKQGVLSDMSIGYTVDEYEYNKDGHRLLKKLSLWEVSIVGEPANPQAKISEVKNRTKDNFYTISDVKYIDNKRDYEHVLRESGAFSKEAAVFLASHFVVKNRGESVTSVQDDNSSIINSINELKLSINKL